MIHFVGAGSGAPDLITVRGQKFLRKADVVIYAGSLVNPELLKETKPGCEILNSAYMTLDEVIRTMEKAEREGKMTVRLHTGDPAIYGAIREQMDRLDEKKIAYDVCPGVSSFCGAASSLHAELTLPGVSQSVIITTDLPFSASAKAISQRSISRFMGVVRNSLSGKYGFARST